ncbi:MAG: bifunctional UDP-N-acetylglucosamine diphosphorylase/glucosamine-1-phosphate N-acetyltransferase GlmU [Alphaproteobacteria bacterium]|nr:bifunctional UDP-N-acetylglucosamine diphosphorylase/glucosamine-1-phosphate N-acetyltransferase GlmU [Alphaproteobacteria bacterium]
MNKTLNTAPLACVVLAAGQGTRMKSDLPKVLHPVAGLPMIQHVVAACLELAPEKIVVVIPPDAAAVDSAVSSHICLVQEKPLGTGDAVKSARKSLSDFAGDIIILFGDTPLVTAEALQGLREKREATGAAIVVAGFMPEDPAKYGRLIVDAEGHLTEIVEASDATPEQRQIKQCNGGIMLFDAQKLWPLLDKLNNANAKNEYYLTDCVKLAREQGWSCYVADMPAEDVSGINNRIELARAEKIMQGRLRRKAMLNGVTMIDPETVYLSYDTVLGNDVTIGPNVVFAPGVRVADGVEIRSFCHIAGTRIEAGAVIGPFARLRPDSVVGTGVRIGNFVEVKNVELGADAKVNHLTYLGDATIGSRANIGAGTITCNYDGFSKARTEVGAGAFIGSNTALVAPVTVGSGAYVAAGSVITMDVAADALSVARGRQTSLPDWARRYREEKEKQTDGD